MAKYLAIGLLAISSLGCNPQSVVVTPDTDDGTAIVEKRDGEIERVDPAMPLESDNGVEVEVGGGKGVDVDINRDATNDTDPNL